MADEPGGWELQRSHEQLRQDMREGFASLGTRLDKVVTAEAFAAEQRRVDDKIRDLADDIAAERREREKLTATQRWLIAAILLPIALTVVTILISKGVL